MELVRWLGDRPVRGVVAGVLVFGLAASGGCGSHSSSLGGAALDHALQRARRSAGRPSGRDRRGAARQRDRRAHGRGRGRRHARRRSRPTTSCGSRASRKRSAARPCCRGRDGTVSLDDTVGRWRPDLPSVWAPVTLRQLLDHTSGIPDFSNEQSFLEAVRTRSWSRRRRSSCCRFSAPTRPPSRAASRRPTLPARTTTTPTRTTSSSAS